MKLQKAAAILGVNRRTVVNWISNDDLAQFFSVDAKRKGSPSLSEQDMLVLNTIHSLRENGVQEWSEIASRISSGELVSKFPLEAVKTENQFDATALELYQVNVHLKEKLVSLEKENETLEKQLENEREKNRQQETEVRKEYEQRLLDMQSNLLREIATLNFKLGRLGSEHEAGE